jgi:hypothetical protein
VKATDRGKNERGGSRIDERNADEKGGGRGGEPLVEIDDLTLEA